MVRVSVERGSELDRTLTQAEDAGDSIELVHGARTYLLQLVSAGGVLSDEERAWRKALVERTLALRNSQPPLGISTAELIRETCAERYGE